MIGKATARLDNRKCKGITEREVPGPSVKQTEPPVQRRLSMQNQNQMQLQSAYQRHIQKKRRWEIKERGN